VLSWVKEYVAAHGLAPTYDEIGAALGVCKVTVLAHLRQLEQKGLIQHEPYAPRAIEVCEGRSSRIPLAGVIQAGSPILAVEEAEKINLLELLPLGEDLFSLKVKGDSMVDDHIHDGDFVIIQKTATARPGEVVVALIDGEVATLKRFHAHGSQIRLEPANAAYQPLILDRERVQIQGRVLGVLRLYG
jgi:repressor LexA